MQFVETRQALDAAMREAIAAVDDLPLGVEDRMTINWDSMVGVDQRLRDLLALA
jgi:hypothetical protein